MPSDNVTKFDFATFDKQVSSMSDAELQVASKAQIEMDAVGFMKLTRLHCEHKNRNIDASIFGHLIPSLEAIYERKLLPSLAADYRGTALLPHLQKYPLGVQEQIAQRPVVPVLKLRDGRKVVEDMLWRDLSTKELNIVVDPIDGIREPEEQFPLLASVVAAESAPKKATRYEIDEDCVVYNRRRVSVDLQCRVLDYVFGFEPGDLYDMAVREQDRRKEEERKQAMRIQAEYSEGPRTSPFADSYWEREICSKPSANNPLPAGKRQLVHSN